MKKNKVGIIGCGTIGGELAKKIAKGKFPDLKLAFLCDSDQDQAKKLQKKILKTKKQTLRVASSIETLIKQSDIVIEAASSSVSARVARKALRANCSVLIMSVGGLVTDFAALQKCAQRSRGTLFLPSGAVCGIDGILAAKESQISRVTLTTRKPVKGLIGAPYFEKKGIDITKIKKETIVFDGTAQEAITYFPKNINVAAILSLAGLGIKKTRVRIATSPLFKRNSHEICAEGSFGTLVSRTENVPSPSNPKTSYMAILAAEAVLRKISSAIKIGS